MNMIITRNFYENFTGLSGDTLDKVATEGFRSMTAVGTMTTMMRMTTMMMKMTMMMVKMTMMMLVIFDGVSEHVLLQNGDYELDYSSYKLLFSNFLLGRTIYGPGF